MGIKYRTSCVFEISVSFEGKLSIVVDVIIN